LRHLAANQAIMTMPATTATGTWGDTGHGLDVRVEGPESRVDDADLRRLFSHTALSVSRQARIRADPRVVVMIGGRIVAMATCHHVLCEMRVCELAIDVPASRAPLSIGTNDERVLHALVDAIEVMAMAGGCRRVILSPPRSAMRTLQDRGYRPVENPAHAGWLERSVT
jgi:hypothetical protein